MAIITTKGNRDRLSTHFESLTDVWETIEAQGWKPDREQSSNTTKRAGDSFYIFKDLAEARDVYQNRPETIRTFTNADVKLESIESPGKGVEYDVTGDYIDIQRHLDGDPEDQGNMVLGNPRSMFATINIMVSYVWYTETKYLERKQRRILRLVDWLESQGIRCQIVATASSQCLDFSCVVKQFSDPVDLNDLAVVCHGDFLRRVLFLIKEQSNTWSPGYGNATNYDDKMKTYAPQPDDGIYIYVGGFEPSSDAELEENFGLIELQVQKLVEKQLTWNEKPIVFYGHTFKRNKANILRNIENL